MTEEKAQKQLKALLKEGNALVEEFEAEERKHPKPHRKYQTHGNLKVYIRRFSESDGTEIEEEPVTEPPPPDHTRFRTSYQSWYTRALPLMKELAADRYMEFQSYYAVDMRFYWRDAGKYHIQDFLRGEESADAGERTALCFRNQLAILQAVSARLAWSTLDSEDDQLRLQQLGLLETARKLIEVNERAAGVIAASVLSTHLAALAAKHRLKSKKQSPPPAELVDALQKAKVLDAQTWNQASGLADLHDRCLGQGESPTRVQVRDLIDGTRWLLTNIF